MAVSLGDVIVRFLADTGALEGKLEKAGESFQKFGARATQAGFALSAAVTAPLVAVGGGALKMAIDFEDAFAGVRKTVDATEAEFAVLETGILNLSRRIPVAAEELAGIGEAAGQLGIQKANILGFTEVVANLAAATNLSSQQAATSLARIANITKLPQSEFGKLGATIVDLGNNFATTEAEIVEFGLRIAGAGAIAKIPEAGILAIGTALSSLGVEAEAGGTATQKVLLEMVKAVGAGGKELKTFAQVAGVSTTEFARAFREDAQGAFVEFVEGLGKQGDRALQTLADLGLEDQRLIRSFLALAGSGDLLRRAIETGNVAWRENRALTEEAEKRYRTAASQLKLLWNEFKIAAITLGNELVPMLKDLVREALIPATRRLVELAAEFGKLPGPVKVGAVAFLGLVAAIGPVVTGLGLFAMGAGSLVTFAASLAPAIPAVVGFFTAMTAGAAVIAGPLIAALTAGAIAFGLVTKAMDTGPGRKFAGMLGDLINKMRGLNAVELERGKAVFLSWTPEERQAYLDFLKKQNAEMAKAAKTPPPTGPPPLTDEQKAAIEKYRKEVEALRRELTGTDLLKAVKQFNEAVGGRDVTAAMIERAEAMGKQLEKMKLAGAGLPALFAQIEAGKKAALAAIKPTLATGEAVGVKPLAKGLETVDLAPFLEDAQHTLQQIGRATRDVTEETFDWAKALDNAANAMRVFGGKGGGLVDALLGGVQSVGATLTGFLKKGEKGLGQGLKNMMGGLGGKQGVEGFLSGLSGAFALASTAFSVGKAIVGLFRKDPVKEAQKEIGRVLGHGVSREFAEEVRKRARDMGIALADAARQLESQQLARAAVERREERGAGVERAVGGFQMAFTEEGVALIRGAAAAQGKIFTTTFWAAVSEQGFPAAVDAFKQTFDAIKEALPAEVRAGLEDVFKVFAEGPARDAAVAAKGFADNIAGLAASGYLTRDAFLAFGETAFAAFQQALGATGNEHQALVAILPLLANIKRIHEETGFPIDENTKRLIEQAEAMGLAFPVDPMLVVIDLLREIAKVLGADIPASALKTQRALEDIPSVPDGGRGGRGGRGGPPPEVPPDVTAQSGFFSPSMPRGPGPGGMTTVGVHPREEVFVRPSGAAAPAAGLQPGQPVEVLVYIGGEKYYQGITRATKTGQVRVHPTAIKEF